MKADSGWTFRRAGGGSIGRGEETASNAGVERWIVAEVERATDERVDPLVRVLLGGFEQSGRVPLPWSWLRLHP